VVATVGRSQMSIPGIGERPDNMLAVTPASPLDQR
jgi:hypothetical protein